MDTKTKWNNKHQQHIKNLNQPRPNERLKNLSSYFTGEQALDIACGLGANSFYLAELGYQVDSLDISDVAIQFIKTKVDEQRLSVTPRLCDLTELSRTIESDKIYDLVVVTYYLDRAIFPFIKTIINENGYVFMETFYKSSYHKKEGVSDKFKLNSNELLSEFADWHILFYEEHELEGRQTILARKKPVG
ncbi:class I SAM-dependent methyltransferase [Bacillus sp. FJAT-45350]|uniref:class I SAM-dependent methyltransferase n=1 Tax=Bacillus sp. FJAT-45350 TaxID=2011014 RepID=UPI0015CADD00|nr:methyltransferase domain-containing protein [Bacillus sp. FJAT-45350]